MSKKHHHKKHSHEVNGNSKHVAEGETEAAPPQTNGESSGVREEAYKKFNDALERTKKEVRDMQGKLEAYDEKFQASNTVKAETKRASDFFKSSLDEVKAALDQVAIKAKEVFITAKTFSTEAASNLFKQMQEAMEKFKALVLEFDEKHNISTKISEIVTPLLNRVKALEEQTRENVKEMGKNGRSFLINAAAKLDNRFGVEERLNDLDGKFKLSEKAEQLRTKGEEFIEKNEIKNKVKSLDEKITGSRAGGILEEGLKVLKGEFEKLTEDFEIARENSKDNLQELSKEKEPTQGMQGISA